MHFRDPDHYIVTHLYSESRPILKRQPALSLWRGVAYGSPRVCIVQIVNIPNDFGAFELDLKMGGGEDAAGRVEFQDGLG